MFGTFGLPLSLTGPWIILAANAGLVAARVGYMSALEGWEMSYRRFRRIAVVAFAAVYAAEAQQPVVAQHSIAAIEKDRFHGWPANNGAWQWGDELLVGFTQGDFAPQDGHNIAGIQQSKFARSLDGGVTWQVFDPENFLDGEDIKWLPKGKTMLDTPMDFANPGFAMRVFASGYHGNDDPEGGFYFSYDRGATWKGPHFFATRGNSPEDARRGDRVEDARRGDRARHCHAIAFINLSMLLNSLQ